MQSLYLRSVGEDGFENFQLRQNGHPGGLQQESRAHRFAIWCPFENLHAVSLPREQSRCRRSG